MRPVGGTRRSSHRRTLAAERLCRAQELGPIRAAADVQVLIDQLWGAVHHRLLIPDEPVTDAFVTTLVADFAPTSSVRIRPPGDRGSWPVRAPRARRVQSA
ncbi:TetR-like C-terminal domain-containing protein [Streptomyces sp. NPDC005897]|uniref:TetR-like C-terminal domain-containing protein n=1 Tax=Streptomyces sp. NPDC005897 TaxID=3157081 RepID=UPI00340507E2